jgi:macrolide transport system ATP-binding/permease protein
MENLIQISDVGKTYEVGEIRIHALRGVSFDIQRGEFVAVMGASGSGKSTLMNLIGCLDRPTAGHYLLEGVDVASLDEIELALIRSRRVGFIFQNFNLLSRTTALENVELPLFYSGWPPDGKQRAQALINMVGLSGREQNSPTQLSGGQQQRVAIARALINEPAILLADEPTGNLDSSTSTEIMEIIRKLNRARRLTVVVVTHDPDIAAYADRVITFRDGVIVSDEKRSGTIPPVQADGAAWVAGSRDGRVERSEKPWTFAVMALSAAGRALQRNKLRAVLTMLGIFIGIAAVIAMVAVGNGARYSVEQQIQSLGTNLLVVLPGATTSNGVRAGFGSTSTLTVADARTIAKEVSGASAVSYMDRQVGQVVYGNRNWSTTITGTTPEYLDIRDWPLASGHSFTTEEAQSAAPVCLLGHTVVNNIFPDSNPIGAIIRVKNFPLKVVGVLSMKGQSTYGQDQDDVVLTPFRTAQSKVLGTSQVLTTVTTNTGNGSTNPVLNPYSGVPTTNAVYTSDTALIDPFTNNTPVIAGVVNNIYVKAADSKVVDQVQNDVQQLLHRRHRIQPKQDDDFSVRSLNEIAEASENASQVMTLLLAAVASISLIVGGIGIMNIMLVSVTERTREIGIRMAIGARRRHILLQFLVESLLLSVLGGVTGIVLGFIASQALSAIAHWPTMVSPGSVIGGFAFAAAVGIFFGWYPARKASLLDPIDALRYE